MKKLLLFAMIIAALGIFNACEKSDESLTPSVKQEIANDPLFAGLDTIAFSVDQNRLVFESEEEFQKCINFLAQLGDSNFPEFEKHIGFDSYRRTYRNDEEKSGLFVDELYQTLLSPEMEIIIGNYLFRESPEDETTLAFYFDDTEDCSLKSSLSSPTFIFSWQEDAFETIDNSVQIKSTTSYCDSNNDTKEKDFIIRSGNWGNTTNDNPYAYQYDLKAKLCFQKTGIFKSIISKIKIESSSHQCYNQYWDGFSNCKKGLYSKVYFKSIGKAIYQRKNKNRGSYDVYEYFYPHLGEDVASWRPFYGTRRILCYNITMEFGFNTYQNAVAPQYNGYTKKEILHIDCNQSDCL